MDIAREIHRCRVCGLDQGYPPWGEDGTLPTFGICECCGTEAGYEDCTAEAARIAREKWIAAGAPWWFENKRPADWQLANQLSCVPSAFR